MKTLIILKDNVILAFLLITVLVVDKLLSHESKMALVKSVEKKVKEILANDITIWTRDKK